MVVTPEEMNELFARYSGINRMIGERGNYNVKPLDDFDYLNQMEKIMNKAERIRSKALRQSMKNARISLRNQQQLPPNIRFPDLPRSLPPVARGGGKRNVNVGGGGFRAGDPAFASSEQVRNAIEIARAGRRLGASRRDIITALTTALTESDMRDLNYGDRDSIGAFQQRNAWGSRRARLDTGKSARMFFLGGNQGQEGLLDIGGRRRTPIGQLAQDVQVSAFPSRYRGRVDQARQIMQFITRDRRNQNPNPRPRRSLKNQRNRDARRRANSRPIGGF